MLRKKQGYFFGCAVAHNFVVNFLRFKLCLLFAENTHDRGKFHYMTDVLLDCFGYDQTSRNNVHKQCNWIQKINSLALQWYFPLSKYFLLWTWSSLPSGRRSGDVDKHLSNGQTNWAIVLQGLSQSFRHFINKNHLQIGRSKMIQGENFNELRITRIGVSLIGKTLIWVSLTGQCLSRLDLVRCVRKTKLFKFKIFLLGVNRNLDCVGLFLTEAFEAEDDLRLVPVLVESTRIIFRSAFDPPDSANGYGRGSKNQKRKCKFHFQVNQLQNLTILDFNKFSSFFEDNDDADAFSLKHWTIFTKRIKQQSR